MFLECSSAVTFDTPAAGRTKAALLARAGVHPGGAQLAHFG